MIPHSYPYMHHDSPTHAVASLPPDLCQKSDDTIEQTFDSHRSTAEASNTNSCRGLVNTDLLQSTCVMNNVDKSSGTETSLPDICEGAGSTSGRRSDYSEGNLSPSHGSTEEKVSLSERADASPSHTSPLQACLPEVCTDFSTLEVLGAKPKVYKSKSTKRSSADKHTVAIATANSGSINKKTYKDKKKSSVNNERENLPNSVSETDVFVQNESLDNVPNRIEIDVIASCTIHNIERESLPLAERRNSDEVSNTTASNNTNDHSSSVPNADNLDDPVEDTESLMDEYLLHNSRPISLVACGIWDCSSGDSEELAGIHLVRSNLHTASHPMFSKWTCEACIPSHLLCEVAFNSHGAFLGASAGGGSIETSPRALDDSEALEREQQQVRLAKRMTLIQHLPQGTIDAGTNIRECVICMVDLVEGERVRYLPCMHVYHTHCIDDWFQRAFTCPSCLEPVDAALLNTYNST